MANTIRKVSIKSSILSFCVAIFLISLLSFPFESVQDVFSSSSSLEKQQQSGNEESNSSLLTFHPANDSGTIQCITTPCEYPSPQPMPPESNNNNTSIPKNVTQLPDLPQPDPNNPDPCISPCPPGEICIQMCKPIGDVETSVLESGSSLGAGQGQQNGSTPNSDDSSDNQALTNEIEEKTNANNNNNDESSDTSDATKSSETITS